MAQRRNRVTLAQWDGTQLLGLASASTHAEDRVWELDRLFLPHDDLRFRDASYPRYEPWEAFSQELLRVLTQEVGLRRAERVLLRLPSGSPIVPMARAAGFSSYLEETVLGGWGGGNQPSAPALPEQLREKTPQDDHALFQLVTAATPQSVRVAVGLTFSQWLDTHKADREGRTEWVVGSNGRITGWLGLTHRRLETKAEVLVHPDNPGLWEDLVECALVREGPVRWLVPEYQELVASLLLRRGFREVAQYNLLIKTLAVLVVERRMAPMEA